LGAATVTTTTQGDVTLHVYSQRPGGEPQLGYAVAGDIGFVAAGPSVLGLAQWALLKSESSLENEPPLQRSLSHLPASRDFFAYLPGTSSYLRGEPLPSVTLAGALSPASFTIFLDAPWPNTQASLKVLDKQDAPDLLPALPKDAFLVARFAGEPSLLAPFWTMLVGPYVAQAAQQAVFDVKAEVLDNLKPGAALGLSVAPSIRLAGGMPELDVRRTNPFSYVQLVALAKAKDAAKASATLEKIPPVAERFGAHVQSELRNGRKVYLTTYSQGEGTDFALAQDTLVLAAPVAQLDAALARLSDKSVSGPLPDANLRTALFARGASVVVDLHQLGESVKALPASAWGIGGFAIKATTVNWLDATDDLTAVTAALSEKDGAVQGELSLRFAPK
jgi:hypothetical protein